MRALLVLLVAGCATRVGVGPAIDGTTAAPKDYPSVFDAWTQSGALHDGMATVLLAKATLIGPPMARALDAERKAWMEDADPAQPDGRPWTVAFSAASDLDDLGISTEKTPAAWQIGMLVDGSRCTLIDVGETKITALTHRLYPNLSTWDRQWVAHFSGCPATGSVELQFTSAHGAMEFGWEVTADGVAPMRRSAIR